MDMRSWLEGYLARYPGAAVVVSHDRAFLDAACDTTAEVARGELRVGGGNPSAYRAAREEAERVQAATRANQERESARLHAAAEQMKRWAGQNAKLHRRAKAMLGRAERFDARMVDEVPRPERTTRFAFDCDESGDIVLTARHLTQRMNRTLFEDVTVELRQGDRVALVGPNGAGKTTFLRTLLGELPSLDPRASVTTGARVRLGYYDQDLRGVDDEATLFEELLRRMGDREAHDALGRFMFPYEAQFKKVRDLSGGERARLALLLLTLGRHNLLVLDEPTNHLDVEMIEALEDALRAYRGTLLVVSHDRRFLAGLVDRVWEVDGGAFRDYEGDWSFYWRKRRERAGDAVAQPLPAGPARPAAPRAPAGGRFAGRSPWRLRRDLAELEARIAEVEDELERIGGGLSSLDDDAIALVPELASRAGPPPTRAEVIAALGERHAALEARLLELMEEWHELTDLVGA
jgi:ATP-binding cassette subfamily F protein 3